MTEGSEVIPDAGAQRRRSGAPMGAGGRWARFVKIVAVFTIVAPFIGGVIAVLVWELAGLLDGGSEPDVAEILQRLLHWIGHAYVFGAVPALLVGLFFAAFAVFARRASLWIALVALPLLLLPTQVVVGDPIWRFGLPFTLFALTLFVVPATAVWYLTRRWHT